MVVAPALVPWAPPSPPRPQCWSPTSKAPQGPPSLTWCEGAEGESARGVSMQGAQASLGSCRGGLSRPRVPLAVELGYRGERWCSHTRGSSM